MDNQYKEVPLFDLPKDWEKEWEGMPEFKQQDLHPIQSVMVHFRNREDREQFAQLIEQRITDDTVSLWYPRMAPNDYSKVRYGGVNIGPKYPIYIISKGRWESRLTSKSLEKMEVPYHIVVEPQEYDQYAAVIDPQKILILPFSNLGLGSIPARNWVWEHALSTGATRHWILDDNINGFVRWNDNKKVPMSNGNAFRAAEDFVDRYENVADRKSVV